MVDMKRTDGESNIHLVRIDRETRHLSAKLGLAAHLPVLCGSDHVTDPPAAAIPPKQDMGCANGQWYHSVLRC